mmetsp:Transcript_55/g.121  ORF Transcript_55/g.121 Transcript_55/m.121 type:complete len:670 (+) Transcript_55:256-2265(+)|eukprot:CAMPEP_0201117124 /NCGR_PEP_ID=MMETSP0850-20130426/1192_1 /ASSEMBLY_ACC=CAM_ASM_000622 /TAXON_ID=183588 /ORGANISM="Pseudo-nitzschia fraudulenta, Strain WWA7" /LENGTH=669 /DNA_ID=CAMNT_0047381365 /DNA_START=162 /DNA_END=2171 /DNA_ORIENTATION=-
MSKVLSQDAVTVNTIEYDFEDYALQHGIPETLDPLPYRKAGSVFSNSIENDDPSNPRCIQVDAASEQHRANLTSAKHDPRLRTVVCRHWLRDLCMKGSACEFLHQYDLSKMPLCRHGERCKISDCPFRHISEANRLECVFYSQGFCIHGPFCRYKHMRRDRQDLPLVSDFTLGLSQMQAAASQNDGDGGGRNGYRRNNQHGGQQDTRRPAPKPNEFFKISLCKHFLQGDCPFGENCHFAHGEHELRQFPNKKDRDGDEHMEDNGDGDNASGAQLHDNIFNNASSSNLDYFHGGASGGGKPSPILEPENAKFFIVLAATQTDLSISTVQGEWYIQAKHAKLLNDAYQSTKSKNDKPQVMIFFTVSDSRHIQGAAVMTSEAVNRERILREDFIGSTPPESQFTYRFSVEWYRTTEMSTDTALGAAPDLFLPTSKTQLCHDMSWKTGESLMKAVWNSPLVALYESWGDSLGENEEYKEPPAADALLTDFRCPSPNEVPWPVMPGPGFIFGCSSDTMDECLGRGILGMPMHMKGAAQSIVPGTSVFLFNVTDRLLFGIFEALTPARVNIEPTAFSKNPKATSSPFPVQVRVRVSLECPPLEDTDPVLNDILRSRGKSGRIGGLTFAQTEAIATLLANQCGALQYMMDYQQGLWEGVEVNPPPIALPPRKVDRK